MHLFLVAMHLATSSFLFLWWSKDSFFTNANLPGSFFTHLLEASHWPQTSPNDPQARLLNEYLEDGKQVGFGQRIRMESNDKCVETPHDATVTAFHPVSRWPACGSGAADWSGTCGADQAPFEQGSGQAPRRLGVVRERAKTFVCPDT